VNRIAQIIRTTASALAAAGVALLAGAMSAAAATPALTVSIVGGPAGTTSETTATFAFSANVRDARFTCSIDGAASTACTSPKTYRALSAGEHGFVVTAIVGRETARASRSWKVEPSTAPPPPAPTPVKPCVSALVVICFDDLAPGTVVASQYAAQGVELGFGPTSPSGGAGSAASIALDAGAWSDGHVLLTPGCSGDVGCPGHTIFFRFTSGHHVVRVRGGGGDNLTLTALGATGNQLAQQAKQTTQGTLTLLEVTSTQPILYFTISGTSPYGSIKLDNLEFDLPDPNAKPDFALAWIPPWGGDKLALVPSGPASSTTIYVTRFNGSIGPIAFSVSGLPAGVTASVQPSPINGTTTVTLKAKASATATTGGLPVPVSVIGHPWNASAGPADRKLKIPLLIVLSNYDVKVKGIEVTQGIQGAVVPYQDGTGYMSQDLCKNSASLLWGGPPGMPHSYQEEVGQFVQLAPYLNPTWMMVPAYVRLVKNRKTVVRVFASIASPKNGAVANVPALLYGYHDGIRSQAVRSRRTTAHAR
jgi:hypothetical protein